MKKNIKKMWIFNGLMWVSLLIANISNLFSRPLFWFFMGVWLVFATLNIVFCVIVSKSIKKETQKTILRWDAEWMRQLEQWKDSDEEHGKM
jgi:hypothetical protein